MSWASLRAEVYRRDGGICQTCLVHVGRRWDCGHLVDRCVGGLDELDNLYLSCIHCNRLRKPVHRTLGEALEWLLVEQFQARTGCEVPAEVVDFVEAMYAR